MKRLNITLFCFIVATNVFSAELPKGDEQLIETAGVQIYPGAIFVNGNKDVGFFALQQIKRLKTCADGTESSYQHGHYMKSLVVGFSMTVN